MADNPALKTGTLLSPAKGAPVSLKRSIASTSGLSFEGMPPEDSPAQRTFHQSLVNRRINNATVYQFLREYGLKLRWGHDSEDAPGTRLHLTITDPSGVLKLAVMFKTRNTNAHWGAEAEDQLTHAGWHILILDAAQLVQTPQDAVDSLLRVLRHVGGLEFATAPLTTPPEGDTHDLVSSRSQAERPRPQATRENLAKPPKRRPALRSAWRTVVLGILAIGTASVASLVWLESDGVESWWHGGVSYRAKVQQVKVTKEGHASLELADGKKAFVPAHAIKRNAELLHYLIVAWRQGKPLTIFTTSKQHAKYGRQVGIKGVNVPPAGKPHQ